MQRTEFPNTLVVGSLTYTKVEDYRVVDNRKGYPLITRGPFYSLPTVPDKVFMPSIEYMIGQQDTPSFMHPLPKSDAPAETADEGPEPVDTTQATKAARPLLSIRAIK